MIRFFRKRRSASPRVILNPVLRRLVRARALMLADPDERYFSPEWLERPDVYCVAQENDVHALHHERGSLFAAFSCFRKTRWFMATTHEGRVTNMREVTDPLAYLVGDERHVPLPPFWTVSPFILFSVEHPAAILYTHAYEFKLVSGTAEFVREYIDMADKDPVDELREWWQEDMDRYAQEGRTDTVTAIQRTLGAALSQVKLPPPDQNNQSDEDFCRELAVEVPAIAPVLTAHLESGGGELFSYIFLSDVVEWAEENAVTSEPDVLKLLAALNRGLAVGERHVPNLIAVGFAERFLPGTPLIPLLQGDLKGWYEFDQRITEKHPYLRRDGK